MNTPTTHRGFTLIELMIALVVMALVLTLGVPSFRNIILDNRQVSELNVLVAELNWARSEAVARNAPVTLKRSGSSWNDGWQIFVDYDKDG
nr:GspH/FimT family pseudopilin [Methylotetracoccus sp.]